MKRSYFSVINRILLFTVVFLSACAGFGGEETAVHRIKQQNSDYGTMMSYLKIEG